MYIVFLAGEVITEVSGRTSDVVVDQLSFTTTTNSSGATTTYGPFGITGLRAFRVRINVIGFYGRAGQIMDSIGFYYTS